MKFTKKYVPLRGINSGKKTIPKNRKELHGLFKMLKGGKKSIKQEE